MPTHEPGRNTQRRRYHQCDADWQNPGQQGQASAVEEPGQHVPTLLVGSEHMPFRANGCQAVKDVLVRPFRVWLRSGEYIFVIVEHASKVDPEMASRLLHYRLPIWDRETEASDVKPGRRTPILALVVYHGKAPWTAPLSLPGMMTGDPALHDMTGGDSALGERISGGGYWLLDIGRMREDQLGNNPDLKGGLLVLQHAYRGPVGSRVLRRVRELISEGTKFERQTYQYILDAFDADMDTILAAFETKGATTMRALAHSVVGKAHAEGVAEGEAERPEVKREAKPGVKREAKPGVKREAKPGVKREAKSLEELRS